MKTIHVLQAIGLAVLAAVGAGVRAQEATPFDWSAPPSTRSRAEVTAEVARARADGTLRDGGEVTEFALAPSTLSRAQVVAEAIEARRLGLLGHGELNPRIPTAEEQQMIAEVGRRAVRQEQLAKK